MMAAHPPRTPPLAPLYVGVPVARPVGRAWTNTQMLARVREDFRGDADAWERLERRIRALWQLCGTQVRTLEEEAPLPLSAHVVPLAHEALTRAGLRAEDVDLLVHGDLAREVYEPATAAEVADRLGAHGALPIDVSSACASWVLAVQSAVARMSVDPELRVALVSTATLTAGHVRHDLQDAAEVDHLGAGLTLGNAASATLIVREPVAGAARVLAMHAAGLPAHQSLCRAPIVGAFESHGASLFALARHVPPHLERLCARAGWSVGDVDLWAMHQPSNRALRDLARAMEIAPGRMPGLHAVHGNCAASAVPLAWATAEAEGACPPGAKIVLGTAASGFVVAGLAVEKPAT